MERIGLAASKMAQGNPWLYNFYVVLISFLFSLFMFVISGSTVLIALIIISYIGNGIMDDQLSGKFFSILNVCLISLSIIIGVFNLVAIIKNLKFTATPPNP